MCWLAVASIAAQDSRGQIIGRVTDSSGAAVPGAEVKATNTATNVTLTSTANELGNYEALYLQPGIYSVRAMATEFKSYARENIEVRVSDHLSVDITLELGAVTETVNMTATTPLLESTNANLGDVVNEHRITDLPLSGGSALTLR